jgi:hypothetical protein
MHINWLVNCVEILKVHEESELYVNPMQRWSNQAANSWFGEKIRKFAAQLGCRCCNPSEPTRPILDFFFVFFFSPSVSTAMINHIAVLSQWQPYAVYSGAFTTRSVSATLPAKPASLVCLPSSHPLPTHPKIQYRAHSHCCLHHHVNRNHDPITYQEPMIFLLVL